MHLCPLDLLLDSDNFHSRIRSAAVVTCCNTMIARTAWILCTKVMDLCLIIGHRWAQRLVGFAALQLDD